MAFCLYRVVPFFHMKFLTFLLKPPIYMIAAVLSLRPQDLGVLESSLHPWHRKSSGCPRKWWKWTEVCESFLEAVDPMKQGRHIWNETATHVQCTDQCAVESERFDGRVKENARSLLQKSQFKKQQLKPKLLVDKRIIATSNT